MYMNMNAMSLEIIFSLVIVFTVIVLLLVILDATRTKTKFYVTRNPDGEVRLFADKPTLYQDGWSNLLHKYIVLDKNLFPHVKWGDEPLEVTINNY